MIRSKLETYIEILTVLAEKGPLKLTNIMRAVGINEKNLKGHLGFLGKQGLVEEQTIGAAYAIFSVTQQGIKIAEYFHLQFAEENGPDRLRLRK
jgi:predicted transcriptional regulator